MDPKLTVATMRDHRVDLIDRVAAAFDLFVWSAREGQAAEGMTDAQQALLVSLPPAIAKLINQL